MLITLDGGQLILNALFVEAVCPLKNGSEVYTIGSASPYVVSDTPDEVVTSIARAFTDPITGKLRP